MTLGNTVRIEKTLENIIHIATMFILTFTIVIMGVALLDDNNTQEAPIGSFDSRTLNDGWHYKGESEEFSLPYISDDAHGDEVIIVNTLPDDLSDNGSLLVKASMEDVYIFVDGKMRAHYSSETISDMSYYIPSAYVVADLNKEDSGKEVSIVFRFKTKHTINEISIGDGNNVWFDVLKKSLAVNLIGLFVLVSGLIIYIVALIISAKYRVAATRFLGLLMVNMSLWMVSESTVRQFIFNRPSLSMYFSYLLVEMAGAVACFYFDEVQHRHYHKRYLILEAIVVAQVIINIILHVTDVMDLHESMTISHGWMLIGAAIVIFNIVSDIRIGRVKEYRITVIGMIGFLLLSIGELLGFYLNRFHAFGTEICVALLVLMGATVIQTIYDEVERYEQQVKDYTLMTVNTIETIASAIDARDEYTGGHSERVSLYASRLAREMAADYDLTEEDILRVQYIGLIHDIGKIGVADNVLNKSGILTEEEVSLMKKHTQIGYEIMASLGGAVEGLLDGIRYHHERFDGKGYPDRLSDTDIPLIARILALADSYDAMTSNRVYRSRLSDEEVRAEIEKNAGTQFDPALAEIFIRLLDSGEIRPITIGGAATDSDGTVRNSAVLEKLLQIDMLNKKEEVLNPSHVRMLCYIMKLMEKKGIDFQVVFVDMKKSQANLTEVTDQYTNAHDVIIRYTDTKYIIALYNKSRDELTDFITKTRAVIGEADFEVLKRQ